MGYNDDMKVVYINRAKLAAVQEEFSPRSTLRYKDYRLCQFLTELAVGEKPPKRLVEPLRIEYDYEWNCVTAAAWIVGGISYTYDSGVRVTVYPHERLSHCAKCPIELKVGGGHNCRTAREVAQQHILTNYGFTPIQKNITPERVLYGTDRLYYLQFLLGDTRHVCAYNFAE